MNNRHFANKDKAVEQASGGQGEIKCSQLTPEELKVIRVKYPAPTGANAKKPIPIYEFKPRKELL
ncbi:hypothetical protein [Paenibacillus odorifer]|uniref:hypothetical protein n=1 Tax=Paenibacillus TaxID=44249 RepID=UPI00096E4DE3|nr:hypothetical protein [Paenibacillus odorifer]OMC97120.1 hypothetical protein BJP46_26835 [Paenibacillus odorifer]